jgi:hypothetical protein
MSDSGMGSSRKDRLNLGVGQPAGMIGLMHVGYFSRSRSARSRQSRRLSVLSLVSIRFPSAFRLVIVVVVIASRLLRLSRLSLYPFRPALM